MAIRITVQGYEIVADSAAEAAQLLRELGVATQAPLIPKPILTLQDNGHIVSLASAHEEPAQGSGSAKNRWTSSGVQSFFQASNSQIRRAVKYLYGMVPVWVTSLELAKAAGLDDPRGLGALYTNTADRAARLGFSSPIERKRVDGKSVCKLTPDFLAAWQPILAQQGLPLGRSADKENSA